MTSGRDRVPVTGRSVAASRKSTASRVPVEAPGATEAAPSNAAGASWIAPPAASLAETLGDVQPGALGTVGFGEPPGGGHEALVAELQSLKGMISRQFATMLSSVFILGLVILYFAPETKGKELPE